MSLVDPTIPSSRAELRTQAGDADVWRRLEEHMSAFLRPCSCTSVCAQCTSGARLRSSDGPGRFHDVGGCGAFVTCCTDRGRVCWQDGGRVRLRLASFRICACVLAQARLQVLSMQQAPSGLLPRYKITMTLLMAAWCRQLMSVFLLRQLVLERLPRRTPCNQLGGAEECVDRACQDVGFASLASPASTRRLDLEAGNVAGLRSRCFQGSTWCIRRCCCPESLLGVTGRGR